MKTISILLIVVCCSGCSALSSLGPRTADGDLDWGRLAVEVGSAVTAGVAEADKPGDGQDWLGYGIATILGLLGVGGVGRGVALAHALGKRNGGTST